MNDTWLMQATVDGTVAVVGADSTMFDVTKTDVHNGSS